MSANDHAGDRPETDDERRVAGALSAYGEQVRPDLAAWNRIDARLDARGASRADGGRRPLLAAAAAVLIVLAGAVVVLARSADDEVQVATAPTGDEQLAILALTDDQRLVELGPDGAERREIYRSPDDGTRLVGSLAASPRDGVIYVERTLARSGPCGDVGIGGGGERVGQIIAVPYAGGEPHVVVAAGHQPDVDRATGRLAYLTPPDGTDCLGPDAFDLAVLDPATGSTAGVAVATASATDGTRVVQPRWSVSGDDVYTLIASGSGIPHRTVVRVGFDGTEIVDAETTLTSVVVGGSSPTGLVGVSSIDPIDPRSDEGDSLVTAGPSAGGTGAVQVVEWAKEPIGPADGWTISTSPVAFFDPSVLGTEPLMTSEVEVDRDSGAILLTAEGSGAAGATGAEAMSSSDGSSTSPGTTPAAETTTPESTTLGRVVVPLPTGSSTYLFVAEGGQPRVVARGVVAATWIRTDGTSLVDAPPVTVRPPEPGRTEPGTFPGTTPTTAPNAGTVPPNTPVPVDVVGSSDRPDDAAAVADAFRSYFEQGDQSALEGSGILEPAIDEGAKTVPNGGKGVTVTIDAITFAGEDSAEVRFRLDQNGNFFTAATTGSAVFVDGRWKVSAATMCTLLSRVQIPCPTAP